MAKLYELPDRPDTAAMSLEELRDAMNALPRYTSEGGHEDADSILEELVERWARMNESESQRCLVREILALYRAMDKEYA